MCTTFWTPAFAGVTALVSFRERIKVEADIVKTKVKL
jgi:hypothetical protein